MKNKSVYLIIFIFVFCFIIFSNCQAALLYLESSQEKYYQGDVFMAEIRIDTEEECINTVEIGLDFSPNVLEIEDFSKGSSLISVWLKEPDFSNSQGFLSFSGGIPGGYCGELPGDPGKSNILGKVIFKVKNQNLDLAEVKFSGDSKVLLNDGKGTQTDVNIKNSAFVILTGSSEEPRKEWQEELEKDKIPPEPFKIKITKDPLVFDGDYFAVFSAIDKQTGINYYEIKKGEEDWQKVTSPYLLKDQSLEDIIQIRVIDKAGNARIAEYIPFEEAESISYWLVLLIILIIVLAIWRFFKKRNL